MKNDLIKAILDLHRIKYQEKGSSLYAVETGMICKDGIKKPYESLINVTGWSKKDLLSWIGY